MGEDPATGAGLFAGTAEYYARFRPPYPPALLDAIIDRFRLDESGRLLDLGCGTGEITVPHVWTIDTLVGYLYSTSFCSPALLGRNQAAFENDLRHTLLALNPAGLFAQTLVAQYILASKG